MWRPSALGSRRAPRERCVWSAGGRTSGGSRPASWAAPPWRGSGDAGPRQEPAAPVHGAGLVRLRAHAGDRRGRGGGAAAARPAGGGEWGRGGRGRGRLLRGALCGPLGSLGDRLVWIGWLPLLSALALIGVALGAGWWAIIGFLALYN